MNRWKEQFENHNIHKSVKEIEKFINTNFDNVDEDEIIEKRRLLKFISMIKELLSNIDYEVIPFNVLDNLDAQLRDNGFYSQLSSYSENGTMKYLINANNHITNHLINYLTQFMILSKNFSVNKDIKVLEESLDTFSNAIVDSKSSISNDLKTFKNELNNNSEKLNELNSLIEKRKNETDNLLSQWQQQFSDAQEKRSNDYTNLSEKLKENTNIEIEKHISSNQEKLENSFNQFQSNIDNYLIESKDKHQSILDLYNLTAGDSVAAAYISNANDEKEQADKWRNISICFIVATAIWIGIAFFFDSGLAKDGTTILWHKLISSFSLTGVLLFGAGYSSQQSNKHRNNEIKTRWFALEVKAIDPFISSLDESMQKELKKQLSEKLFAQSSQIDNSDKKIMDEHLYKTIVQGMVDILKVKGN